MARTQKQKIGTIGENIAVKHLVKHNYKIIERNYSKKWGEIDIIAKKNKTLYFIEVKSQSIRPNLVSRETTAPVSTIQSCTSEALATQRVSHETLSDDTLNNVSHETFQQTGQNNWFRPEENVHPWKIKRLSRAIRTYLAEKKVPEEQEFQIDIIAVFIDLANKKAMLRITENIILQ